MFGALTKKKTENCQRRRRENILELGFFVDMKKTFKASHDFSQGVKDTQSIGGE